MELWQRVASTFDRALRDQSLEPIPTRVVSIDDRGLTFVVRVVSRLAKKPKASPSSARTNPFLPYDPSLYVADVSDTHVAILNKFNVVDHHVLIVTREFQPQSSRLSPADMTALAAGLFTRPSLGFYNSTAAAGASQSHRHLQLVPLPLQGGGQYAVPIQPLLLSADSSPEPQRLDGLPFAHGFVALEKCMTAMELAAKLNTAYQKLIERQGWAEPNEQTAYNLLATRQWLLLVPRRAECYQEIAVNALGFCGAMFVRSESVLETLQKIGPMRVLQEVTMP